MRAGVFVILFACGCASQQKLPPGNDLENAEQDAYEKNTVGESRMPGASTDLAKAFDAPEPAKSPALKSNVPSAAPVVDDMAAVREAFAQELALAKKAVAAQA